MPIPLTLEEYSSYYYLDFLVGVSFRNIVVFEEELQDTLCLTEIVAMIPSIGLKQLKLHLNKMT